MVRARTRLLALAAVAAIALLAACGGSDDEAAAPAETPATAPATPPASGASEADLAGVKDYLLEHTAQLDGLHQPSSRRPLRSTTTSPRRPASTTRRSGRSSAAEVGPLVERMKEIWIEGNPYYERVEGVVAGTPSLAEYDVILDAGSSAAEDPESAVPFDLTLPDGTVLEQPGNLFNLTEGDALGHAAGGPRQAVDARRPRR